VIALFASTPVAEEGPVTDVTWLEAAAGEVENVRLPTAMIVATSATLDRDRRVDIPD
jgi:hypothetical protein